MGEVTATPPFFPMPGGVPPGPGQPGQKPTPQQIMQAVAKMLQAPQAPGQQQPQQTQQNQPTQGMVGQVPGGQPPIPFSTAGPQQPAPPSQMRPQAMQIPMPQNLGQEFGTKAGAVNATVKETIGGLAQFLQNYKNKKQQDESIKAEGYFSQIMAAAQNPSDPSNKMILDVLGSDPKVLKTIEKGMEYTFAKEPGGPPEPEPPESKGLKGAIQKLLGKQQSPPMPQSLPKPGTPGGILLPGPTQQQNLAASQTNAQLSGMQQSPELRQAAAGLALPPPEMQKLSEVERIQAGHDFAKVQVEMEKSQTELMKANANYQKQALANQGRVDAGTQVARINAQARVQAAQIMSQAYMMRAMAGKSPKMPTVNIQNEFSSLNRANSLLGLIMGGDESQETYNQFMGSLKSSGKVGAAIMATVPGQGSMMQKLKAGLPGADSGKDWKAVQKGLGDSIATYQKAIKTTYPDWAPGSKVAAAGAGGAAEGGSLDDQIMKAMDEGEDGGPQQTTSQTTPATSSNVSDDVMKKFMALAPEKRRAALGRMSDSTKQSLLTHLKARKTPQALATPQGAVTPLTAPKAKGSGWLTEPGGTPRKIEAGLEEGATDAFGLKIPDPNKPSSLTWKSIAGQIIGGLGHQAQESLKQFGPLAPLDMIAKGMEGMAEGVESGAKHAVKGVAKGDPEEIARGVLGGGASAGMGMSGMEEGGKIANKISNMPNVPLKTVFSMAKMQDYMDKYIHARGLDLKDTYGKAVKNVNVEIERHAKALNNAIPKDAIDASKELADANKAFDDVVKTPEKYPPVLSQIAQSVKNHPPGRWDFETAKQFRTNINAAMQRSSGPLKAALTQVYKSVTDSMEKAAKSVPGGKFSWDFYNELTRKFHQNFADHVNDILGADSGHKVSGALLRDPSLAREAVASLSKYGLDAKKVTDFIKHSQDVVKAKKFLGNSMFRYIYGTGAGAAAMIGGRMAGLGWVGSIGPAVMAGLSSIYLKNLRTLMELDPSIIDKVEKARAMPGPQAPTAKPGATPQAGAPTGAAPSPTAPSAPAPKIRPLTAAEKLALRKQRAAGAAGTATGPGAQASTTGTPSEPSPTAMESEREELLAKAGKELVSNLAEIKKVESEAKKAPEVQKVPEGVHGDPQEALREKWRERKAAVRGQAVRTEVKGAEEKAIGGGPASRQSYAELPSVDIEKDLSGDSPEGKTLVSALKKMKRTEGWDDDVYRGHLVEMAEGYAKRMAKRKAK